jgi:succinylglutamate desuccinylase
MNSNASAQSIPQATIFRFNNQIWTQSKLYEQVVEKDFCEFGDVGNGTLFVKEGQYLMTSPLVCQWQ